MSKHLHSTEYVEITCEIRLVTDRAVLLHDGKCEAWVPKSQIETPDDEIEKGRTMEVMMATWVAKEHGFI